MTLASAAPEARADEPAAPTLAPSEAEKARGLPIAQVVIAGNRRLAGDDLAGYLRNTRPGKPFSPEGLASDMRELWASGAIDDMEADLVIRDDGVHCRILIRERPAIGDITFTGNQALSAEDLGEALSGQLKKGDPVSSAAIHRAAEKLRARYAQEGYALAEVSSEIVPRKGNQALVRFTIREHERLKVRRITFIGNTGIGEDELRAVMATGRPGLLEFGTGGTFRQDVFDNDLLLLQALYYDRGYLSVEIETPRVMVSPDREGVELTLSIHEGPRFRIRSLKVEERDPDGRRVEPLGGQRHLREMVRARPGDFFNRGELSRDLGAIQTMYRDAGYANIEALPATELDLPRSAVDLLITIHRGPVIRIGRIDIRGNTKTRDKVIRRELEIQESGLFSESAIARSRQRLQALGYFERVEISTQEGAAPSTLDLAIDIGEKPTGTFQVGAGFSSLESFLGTAQIQQANLFGTGKSLALNAQISGLRQLVDLRYLDPYFLDSRWSFAVNAFNQLRVYDQFSQASRGGTLTFGYPILDTRLRASLTYTLQWDKVQASTASTSIGTTAGVSVYHDLPLRNLFNDGRTSSLRAALTYDTRDNQLFPTSGLYLQGSAEIAPSWLGSEDPLVRWRATGRFYLPLTPGHEVVLKLNTEAGLVTSPSPSGVPIFSRFFLGGITDVRGFPLRSLGPRLPLRQALDENSNPVAGGANIGGNLMLYQNLELEFPILQSMGVRGVLFTDLGNAWNLEPRYCRAAGASAFASTNPCFTPKSLLDARASWGFGVRWQSPMGLLRFEWGFPFHPLPYEQPRLFEFTIGGLF